MQYDRRIAITVGSNRRSANWQPQTLMLSEFYEKLRIPARSTETMADYLALKKSEQDDRKDIGGFVAGSLSGPRRKANDVTGRDLITLDFDNIPPSGAEDVLRRVEGLGCGYCIYSTRKHSPAAPRLRILLPYDRTASADEYEPTARYMAAIIGMEFADLTTFEASRLMYWPSVCADAEYVFTFADKPMLSVDGLLAAIDEQYGDWHDVTKWPQVPGSENQYRRLAVKQSDPLAKNGVIGAFCRTYDIYGAIDTFLADVYTPVDNMPGRFTYLGGTTTGGAVVYDNGLFLYSHHATDPCSGRLVNAFDLDNADNFVSFVQSDTARDNTAESVPSTLVIRSVIPGHSGELHFSGDEDLLNALGLNTIQEVTESDYTLSVYDAHSGTTVVAGTKAYGNFFRGIISPNIDIEVDPLPEIEISWDEESKSYRLTGGSSTAILHLKDNSLTLQTGANRGEDLMLHLGSTSSEALRLGGMNVLSRETASRSISILDDGIHAISTQRAKIGAYTNSLEESMTSLTTMSTNLTVAESRIMDADMAKEMMEFVKLQILSRSGTSMLTQANQISGSVLSLMR